MVRTVFKFKVREEAFYWWAAKEKYFRVAILKQLQNYTSDPNRNQYHVRILDDYPNNDWTLSVMESALIKIENPNNLMKDIIK